MKFFLRSLVFIFFLAAQQTQAQVQEPVIGWSLWSNFSNWFPDQGTVANNNRPLQAVGGPAAVSFSDAGDGYGPRAFCTGWASGSGTKAWQFQMSTLKYTNLKFSCKMMGTNNFGSYLGPRDFKLQYSFNGSTWVDVAGGALAAGNGNGNFNSLTNIALPVICENTATLYIRMIMTSNTSVTGAAVTGGQSHIDDLNITGLSNPEAPTDITLSNNFFLALAGGSIASGRTVGGMKSVDFNTGNTFTYTLVAGAGNANNGLFTIVGDSLVTAASLSPGTYSIRLRSTDNTSLYFEKVLTIIVAENDAINEGSRTRLASMGWDGDNTFNVTQVGGVAYNSTNNEYMTVWQGDLDTFILADNEYEIWGQRINAGTHNPVGDRIRISAMGPDGSTAYRGQTPSIAYNATNNEYLVVWSGDNNTGTLASGEYEVWGQRINAATGSLSGSMFRISTMGTDGNVNFDATMPDITWNATANEYMIVWQADDNTSPLIDNEFEIYAQRVSNTGTLTGSRARISTMGPDGVATYSAGAPAIVWNGTNNEYMVVWHGDDNTAPLIDNENEIFSQIVTAAGGLSGSRTRISFMGPNGNFNFNASNADIAWNKHNNEYYVVWQGDDNTAPLVDNEVEIFGQRVSNTAALNGPRLRISDMGPDGNISYAATVPKLIYHAAAREFWVVWQGDDNAFSIDNEFEIFTQRITAGTGAEIGTNDTRVSYMGTAFFAPITAFQPVIAYNSTTPKAFTSWRSDDDTSPSVDGEFDLYGQALSIALTTLPVNWLSFTAKQAGEVVDLDWQTASEQSTRDFTVQYSIDGNIWTDIGVVAAAGNSNFASSYAFVHQHPVTGKNYYRLLQADIDGHTTYSKVLVVNMGGKNALRVYPNPAVEKITIRLDNNDKTVIKIFNNEGKLVRQESRKDAFVTIDVRSLPAGLYHVHVQQSGNVYNQVFLK